MGPAVYVIILLQLLACVAARTVQDPPRTSSSLFKGRPAGKGAFVLKVPPNLPTPSVSTTKKPPPPPKKVITKTSTATTLPQYYINFGLCGKDRQKQEYGTWVLTRPLSKQSPDTLVLEVDTQNRFPVSKVFGSQVEPSEFPIAAMYLAYFDTAGVKAWDPSVKYAETSSCYSVTVNGTKLLSVKDLKSTGSLTAGTSQYSLKAKLDGIVKPSTATYTVRIDKFQVEDCEDLPSPDKVFVTKTGHVAYSFWSASQSLTVDGVFVRDHAWCPVQTGVTVS